MNLAEKRREAGGAAPTKSFVPPPRGMVDQEPKKKAEKEKSSAAKKKVEKPDPAIKRDGSKIKDYYSQWDKYDADGEAEKLDDKPKPRTTNPERFETRSNAKPNAQIRVRTGARPKAALDIARDLKEEANQYFAASKWFDAIEHYTKALAYAEPLAEAALSPDEDHPVEPEAVSFASVLYSNRALAHLKRAEHRHAVDDCDKALALEPGAVKALFRRGTALAKMKRWEHAKADLAQVVEKSPEDKKARGELDYVTRMFTAELERRRERAAKLIADKGRKPKLALRRLPITVATRGGADAPAPPEKEEAAAASAAAAPDAPAEAPATAEVPKTRPKYVPKSVRMAKGGVPSATRSGGGGSNFYTFERSWNKDSDSTSRLALLQMHAGMRAERLPDLFRESLSAELIASVVKTLGAANDDEFAACVLRELPRTKRFEVSVGLLGAAERADLDALLARVAPDVADHYR